MSDAATISLTELCAELAVNRRTAHEWVAAGCPSTTDDRGRRRFVLAAVEAWRAERAAAEGSGLVPDAITHEGLTHAQIRLRRDHAAMALAELSLAVERGKVVDRAASIAGAVGVVTAVRSALEHVPTRLESLGVLPPAARAALEAELRDVLLAIPAEAIRAGAQTLEVDDVD